MTAGTRARLALVASAALFSTGGAAIKATSLGGLPVAGLRSLVAAGVLGLFLRQARRGLGVPALAVAVGYATTMILFSSANKLTTSANTIYLQSAAPLYVLALGPWLLREPLRRRDLGFMGVIAAGLGCFFVGGEGPAPTAPDPFLGNLLATAAGGTWALTIIGLRWLGQGADPHPRTQAALVLGNLLAFMVSLPWLPSPATLGAHDLAVLLYLGTFQIGAAYLLLARGLRGVGALEASLLLLVEPVLNPLWAFLVHGERPGPWALLGAALVMGATTVRALRSG